MNAQLRRAAVVAAATAMAASLAACGSDQTQSTDAPEEPPLTVGLLLPENRTPRYEKFDKPLIEKKISELTDGKGKVVYANAQQNATLQTQQLEAMIAKRVDVIILDSVDSKAIAPGVQKAKDAAIPVVAFDRLAEGPIDAYTGFDNEDVGHVQGRALLEALGDGAKDGKIVMINGADTDPNAAQFKSGAHAELDNRVNIGKEYDTEGWKPENAKDNMTEAIALLGRDNIIGVYSANDGMAGGIISALKAAGFTKLPPVTGQDAELAAVQRIIAGEQSMSVYKPYEPEANAAAELAVTLAKEENMDFVATARVNSPTHESIPAILVPVISLTKEDIKDTVVRHGVYSADEICTPQYKDACKAIGID